MSLAPEQLKIAKVDSIIAREVKRMEQERSLLRQAMLQSLGETQHLKELTQMGSVYSQIAKGLTEFRSAETLLGKQYKELIATSVPNVAQALKGWKDSQRKQQEHIRKILEPLVYVRKSFMVDEGIRQQIKDATLSATAIRDQFKDVLSGLSSVGSVAKM